MSDILIPIEPAPDYNDRTQKYLMPPFQDITASEVMAEFEKRCGSGQQYTTFPNTISDDEKAKLEAAGYVVTANTIDSENIDGVEPTYIGFQVALNDTAAAKNMVIGQKGENGIGGGGSTRLITKSITANGVYNASADNADGYSKVTVDVAGGGGETFEVEIEATIADNIVTTVNKTYQQIKSEIDLGKSMTGTEKITYDSLESFVQISNSYVKDFYVETKIASDAIFIVTEPFLLNVTSEIKVSSVFTVVITPDNKVALAVAADWFFNPET